MGPYRGGQAQYLRVPYADFNALKLPPGKDHEKDFITLADIFPTGWHGVVLSGFKPGESVAVWGAGPVSYQYCQINERSDLWLHTQP
jgi:threonine dehydrogenase-like Zn-dependent dehydrogenase